VSSSTLFLDPDLRVHREEHSDRLLCVVFGGLIRMLAPPRLDTRPVTFHRGASGAARRFECPQHRARGDIHRRIDFRLPPNQQVLQRLRRRAYVVSQYWTAERGSGRVRCEAGARASLRRACPTVGEASPQPSSFYEKSDFRIRYQEVDSGSRCRSPPATA
jgi:hypothetical protein